MHLITCDACNKSGMFFLTLKMSYHLIDCPCCFDHKQQEKSYYFCTLECMDNWIKLHNVFEEGFPCPDCIDYKTGLSTGFLGGFEGNGQCKTCLGEKVLKEMTKEKRKLNPKYMALNEAYQKKIEECGGIDAYMKQRAKEETERQDRLRHIQKTK